MDSSTRPGSVMEYLHEMFIQLRTGTGTLLSRARPLRLALPARAARRLAAWAPHAVIAAIVAALAWHEARTSAFQAGIFTTFASHLTYQLAPGRSPSIAFPKGGPFDERRGYAQLPAFTRRLERRGFHIAEQARFSRGLAYLSGLGVPPPHPEPAATGLLIRGSDGDTLFDAAPRRGLIERYEELPPLVVGSLLYLENRELGDPPDRRSNPVIDWGRLTKAGLLYAGHGIGLPLRVEGGSTLAIQLEKFRHSGDGMTESPADKLRQILAASLNAYREGPDTREARRQIVLDYLNTMPLAAAPGHGEVNGLADGLRVWFARDPKHTFETLSAPESDPVERAQAFKHVLALVYAVRAPSWYLVRDRDGLESRTDRAVGMLEAAGIVDSTFADAVRREPLRFSPELATATGLDPVAAKAPNLIRGQLEGMLEVPDFYALNRLDLDAESTIDVGLQRRAAALFEQMRDSAFVSAHGLRAEHLLSQGDPREVVYSLELYEATPRANALRVHADNLDAPFDVNRDMKMELGSTAKLRTMAHYLGLVAGMHAEMAGLDPEQLQRRATLARDEITRWTATTMSAQPGIGLDSLLAASLERTYSASPYEAFFTGGGVHAFHNFDPDDNHRRLTIREAAAHSTNLVFIRLMRDIERWHQARLPYDVDSVMTDVDNPVRRRMLAEAADTESRLILYRAWRRFHGLPPDAIVASLLGSRAGAERPLTVLWHAWNPGGTPDSLARWLAPRAAKFSPEDLPKLRKAYDNPRLTLLDHAFLLGRHPLEVWVAGALARDSSATWNDVLAGSAEARRLASDWLLGTKHKRAQDVRLRTRVEQDAFAGMLPAWRALGFPFDHLVPSYATAIGSSSDRPDALAQLMGIIVNDGMKRPTESLHRLSFGEGTPYQTTFEGDDAAATRVMPASVARTLRSVLAGVVDHGTAARIRGVFVGRDSLPLVVGGKTGSGDNRFVTFGRGGRIVGSRATSRTAAFVFYIGDRHYGVLTASVTGPRAGQYRFTSALPLAVLRLLAPGIQRELTPGPDPSATAASVPAQGSAAKGPAD